MRKYDVNLRATATVTDAGEVEIEIDLVNLPWEIENDVTSTHTEEQITEDCERVREALMSSPLNHWVFTTLTTS